MILSLLKKKNKMIYLKRENTIINELINLPIKAHWYFLFYDLALKNNCTGLINFNIYFK